MMPPGFVPQELIVALVAPGEHVTTRLDVYADFQLALGASPPKRFLRRVGNGSGTTWTQQGVLYAAQQELELRVPRGTLRGDGRERAGAGA